jgi:hypothetical protein
MVEHALIARRPKGRYLVGREVRPLLAISKLPVRLADTLKLRLAGIPSTAPDVGE